MNHFVKSSQSSSKQPSIDQQLKTNRDDSRGLARSSNEVEAIDVEDITRSCPPEYKRLPDLYSETLVNSECGL